MLGELIFLYRCDSSDDNREYFCIDGYRPCGSTYCCGGNKNWADMRDLDAGKWCPSNEPRASYVHKQSSALTLWFDKFVTDQTQDIVEHSIQNRETVYDYQRKTYSKDYSALYDHLFADNVYWNGNFSQSNVSTNGNTYSKNELQQPYVTYMNGMTDFDHYDSYMYAEPKKYEVDTNHVFEEMAAIIVCSVVVTYIIKCFCASLRQTTRVNTNDDATN